MKFGTRMVLYYSLISVIVLLIVGFAAIRSIEYLWINKVDQQLTEQNAVVQDYIKQVFLFERQTNNELTEKNAKMVASNVSSGVGQLLIYNNKLELLNGLVDIFEHQDFNMNEFKTKVLEPSVNGRIINYKQNNIYYFASPIEKDGKVLGVLVINYKLNLLNLIIQRVVLILCIGAAVFCIVIIMLSILISRKLVVPIKELVCTTENYAKRDFTIVNIDRDDELGQLSKSINDMGMQLKEHIERQKQFVSNVSHELRTPLAAIKGYSEYLADEVMGDPSLDKVIFHLNNETIRLTNLVNDLLQMSRLDSYQESFSFSKMNLSAMVSGIVERMVDRAASRGIVFHSNIQSDVYINGDWDKLVQVVVNILDNSLKYSPDNCQIEINLTTVDGFTYLSIIDKGIGIPKEDLHKVFDRFFRASNSRGINGTGLGLAICKEIIEKHNGRITIDSPDEGGANVSLRLPLTK